MILLYSVLTLLVFSVSLNIYLIFKSKKHQAKTTITQDARLLLKDLLSSGAMLHIRVLDAADYFLKSPRG